MNDPNGFIQWKGRYHLFYQHNPNAPTWGDMHWGHAVSHDLIHWTDLPIALAPTPGSYDEAGVFSGCAVDHAGVPTIFYTSTRGSRNEIQTQSIATGSDDLLTWTKDLRNPILRDVPPDSGQTRDFRDPFVWKEDDGWYMVLGSRIQDVGGAVFLYRSQNLIDWEYLHPLLIGDIKRNGVIWECPNFFKLGDQWMLIVSHHTGTATDTVIYFVGSYENQRFTPVYEGVLDHASMYAPLTTLDDHKRRVLIGWIREDRPVSECVRAGWSGVQSIPRVLTLDGDNRLRMTPVPELETIRGRLHQLEAAANPPEINLNVLALDIEAEFAPQPDDMCGLRLVYSPATGEQIDIVYESQRLTVRRTVRDAAGALRTNEQHAPHERRANESIRLRVLSDGSVVEIIVNERTSLTSRVYPSNVADSRLQVLGSGLQSLKAWEMPSIWQ